MSVTRILILLVAAAAAIGAALMVSNLQSAPESVEPVIITQVETELTNVLVARNDLPVGHYLSESDLVWQPWPTDAPTSAFITDEDDPDAITAYAGAVVRALMAAGEPLTEFKVVHPGEAGFMAAVLTPGMRAVSVQISSETAAGGFILPNDRVDLIVVREVEATRGDTSMATYEPTTILENIRVLAIDEMYRTTEVDGEVQTVDRASRATLELSKQDAEIMSAADQMGALHLTLRSISETETKSGSTPGARAMIGGRDQAGVPVYAYGDGAVFATSGGS